MYQQIRPTWAEIDLDNLEHNVQVIKKSLAPACELIAVVKANAYGHGSVEVAKAALAAGADSLAVSIIEEAVILRRAGLTAPILVMGYTPPDQGALAGRLGVSLAVYEPNNAAALVAGARNAGHILQVQLKVDIGMGRLGVQPEQAVQLASFLQSLPGCDLTAVFSHLPEADAVDGALTLQQIEQFKAILVALEQSGITIKTAHLANSAAVLRYPHSCFSAVRLGLAMYGLYPSVDKRGIDLRPVLSLKTTVTHAKWMPSGSRISYGGKYVTLRPSYIITLPFGYADGYSRSLGGKTSVLVRGQKIPLVGVICMDQCMADATDSPHIQVGDEVTIWGRDGDQIITADEIAAAAGTIVYETVASLSKRVPRLYLRSGRIMTVRTLLH